MTTTSSDAIRQAAGAVHAARQKAWVSRENLASLRVAWDVEHRVLIEQAKLDAEEQARAEAGLRELALAAFRETGDKAPGPGVGIREVTRLEYAEPDALAWAVEHNMALKLDKPAFEKVAKATPLSFVTMKVEPQATIATDLGKALEEKTP